MGAMDSPRRVVVLGSTGSVGLQALDVVSRNREQLEVVGLAAGGSDPVSLARQALDHDVEVVAVARASAAEDLLLAFYQEASSRGYATGNYRVPAILTGRTAAAQLAAHPCDVVLNGINGSIGLAPTLAALHAGHTLALANKESLVAGGALVTASAGPGQIVPIDSEHSALAQSLHGWDPARVRRLVLTASGGPFRGRAREELRAVTPEQAMAHPTWSMGPVVTVNSATLVNKALEVIEAHLLFGLPMERIDVVVHPQSVVHSMVEYVDGSTLAQASPPDMRIPIALGLTWPDRLDGVAPGCDWSRASSWDFEPLDTRAFPAIDLARTVGSAGGTAPAVFNAVNEVCVEAFLAGTLAFLDIVDVIARVVDEHDPGNLTSVDDVLDAETWARARAAELVGRTES